MTDRRRPSSKTKSKSQSKPQTKPKTPAKPAPKAKPEKAKAAKAKAAAKPAATAAPVRSRAPRAVASEPAVSVLLADGASISIDEASGAAALARVKAKLAELRPSELVTQTLNLRQAATGVLGVYAYVQSSGLRPRLERLAKAGELDLSQLTLLPDLARATIYLRQQVDTATAVQSVAVVPIELSTKAQQLRQRMLQVLSFHFDEDPQVAPRLSYIRSGTGYADLLEDLVGLAELYRTHKATIEKSGAKYRPGDEAQAAAYVAEMSAWLGAGAAGGAGVHAEQLGRAGVLLHRAYEEVAAAGVYLCRYDPAAAARFVKFYALGRGRSAGEGGGQGGEPGPDLDPGAGDSPGQPAPPKDPPKDV